MNDPLFWKIFTLKIQKHHTNVPKTLKKTSVKHSIKGVRLQNFNMFKINTSFQHFASYNYEALLLYFMYNLFLRKLAVAS